MSRVVDPLKDLIQTAASEHWAAHDISPTETVTVAVRKFGDGPMVLDFVIWFNGKEITFDEARLLLPIQEEKVAPSRQRLRRRAA